MWKTRNSKWENAETLNWNCAISDTLLEQVENHQSVSVKKKKNSIFTTGCRLLFLFDKTLCWDQHDDCFFLLISFFFFFVFFSFEFFHFLLAHFCKHFLCCHCEYIWIFCMLRNNFFYLFSQKKGEPLTCI